VRHRLDLKVGPVTFRIGSAWPEPLATLRALYAPYPPPDAVADFTVRLEPARPWRRFARPSVAIRGDYTLPDAAPLPLAQGVLAAEMGMNLQMALGQRRYLLLHAGAVERNGRAVILTGHSGAGKSTLSALLGEQGWRFLGDEFVLLEPETGLIHPFPRAISLKNASLAVFDGAAAERLGPVLRGTPKGMIRHLRPPADAIARMDEPARPALILFPRYGREFAGETRPVGGAEVFVRLTQASTNYVALGERGYTALTTLVSALPALAIDYQSSEQAVALVEHLWSELR